MLRIGGRCEAVLVAGVAVSGSGVVTVVCVALRAGNGCVFSSQRIVRVQRMIELRVGPGGGGMTNGAVTGQAHLYVRRILAVGEVGGVARIALCRRSLEDVVDVARVAGEGSMRSGERIAGVFQMVELGVEPAVHGVTALACSRELKPHVIDHRGKEVFLVAGEAIG